MKRRNEKRRAEARLSDSLSRLNRLTDQLEDRLIGLRSQRERGARQRLAGLQSQQVGGFFVHVGQRQIGGASLQRVDHVLGEVLTVLHDRQVRAEGRRLRPDAVQRRLEVV